MKTKKIWLWSFIFGMIATLIVYIGLFSGFSAVSSTDMKNEPEAEEVKAAEEAPLVETEPAKREFANPILEISEGKRAISLYAALAEGVSGYLEPNSYVDIIAYERTFDKKQEKEYKKAVLVLEKVKVLASGKSAASAEEAFHYETVTVEVTPEQGVVLSLAAKDKDGFYFMLRNPEDTEIKEEKIEEKREVVTEGDSD